jgi:hypothetical protein
MAEFNALLFKYLPNGAHFKFFERATGEIATAGTTVQTALGPLTEELNGWFAKENACIEWYRKSPLTAFIAAANIRLDHALVGLSAQVNGARYNPDSTTSAAAERLHIMLKSYGEVIREPYLQEIGNVDAILQHLDGDRADDTVTVGVDAWTKEIQGARNQFVTLMEKRQAQTLLKPEEGFPFVRHGIEGVWHRIVVVVDAGAALNLSPDYATLINKLNPEIDYLNGEFHRVRHNIAAAEPAPIDRQPYTGQPCTPVPEVLYVTPKDGTVKLELGKDFNVTYKNNVDVGNAECTIHGKGAYKGHKTVTFIIAR